MTVALRIVIFLVVAAVCCTLTFGIPIPGKTITYDQRQNGEFNLQVDLKDIALLFLGGSEFLGERSSGTKLFNTFERRHHDSEHSRKKTKKCPSHITSTTTTTTENNVSDQVTIATYTPNMITENNYNHETSNTLIEESNLTPSQAKKELLQQNPVLHHKLSVTTINPESSNYPTSNANEILNLESGSTNNPLEVNVQKYSQMITKTNKPEENSTEENMIAVKTLDRSSMNDIVSSQVSSAIKEEYEKLVAINMATKSSPHLNNVEKPVDVKSQSKIEKVQDSITERSSIPVGVIKTSSLDTKQPTQNKQVETEKSPDMVIVKTVDKPVDVKSVVKSGSVIDVKSASENNIKKTQENPQTSNENLTKNTGDSLLKLSESVVKPQETIVLKTAIKEIVAENHETRDNLNKPVKSGEVVGTKVNRENSVKHTENAKKDMVVVKTVEKPSVAVHPKPVEIKAPNNRGSEKSVVTSSKTTETQSNVGNNNTQEKPVSSENMIFFKTVETPTTPSVVQLSATTQTKINASPSKTLPLTTIGTSDSRKIGDRKPIPSVSLGVAPPTIVTA
ncbi:MATH and LRR domain-containing protein PFE0570w [Daktulosphaira vitifoliae]|uniref:MATH and LRR domain-containing protein PFE0570w n=1 Tax=Daktulosphaira vitifoliae TaxID=58002 RepID=UPI0021A98D62|nr:MATH and LRR domain-containing protein PFE0570w [Daktulosphaira vitifoliae]